MILLKATRVSIFFKITLLTHIKSYNGVLETRNSIKNITKYKSNLHNNKLGNHQNGHNGRMENKIVISNVSYFLYQRLLVR